MTYILREITSVNARLKIHGDLPNNRNDWKETTILKQIQADQVPYKDFF